MHREKTKLFLLIFCFSLILIAFAACTTPENPDTAVPAETEQAIEQPTSSPTVIIETEEPTQELEETEEPEEPEEPEVDGSDDADSPDQMSACVECHTDQTMLIDTAPPQEEVESENEGAG